ncbi:MAG: metallophosphoesterase [Pyrobaculum sp.]
MLIGVISDSHDDWQALIAVGRRLHSMGARVVVHAGDWTSPFSMLKLRRAVGPEARIVTVFGNNDGDRHNFAVKAREAAVEILGEAGALEVDGLKIGIYHGTSDILVEAMARSSLFDVVIYGHTHRPEVRRLNGTLLINPGELCGCAGEKKTAALLDTKTLQVELIEVK